MPLVMPFGEKSDAFIRRSPAEDAKLNFLEGAVRSSKTFAVNVKLAAMVLDSYGGWKWPGGVGLISAVSKTTARTNMLNDIFTMLPGRYKYNQATGELILGGKKFVVCGAKDEGSWKYIRGATVGVWIADEMTVYPRSFFDMALSRLSLQGSRMYGTTNPGNPYHYLKCDYLDRRDLRFVQKTCCHAEPGSKQLYVQNSDGLVVGQTVVGEGIDGRSSIVQILGPDSIELSHPTIGAVVGAKIRFGQLWSEHFTLEDNPNIDEATKESFRRMYRGVFHRWYILGEWCVADGAIYRDVLTEDIYYDDATRPLGLLSRGGHHDRWIPIDVGTVNAFAALDIYDNGHTLWIERELYWDSRKENRQKTNREYAEDLERFLGATEPRRWPTVIVDPSAASFRAELISRGIMVTDGENEVLEGIRKVASMLGQKKIRIHRRCVNLIREMQTYSWNDKSAEHGVEEPIKSNDHTCDSLRYGVHTKISNFRAAS